MPPTTTSPAMTAEDILSKMEKHLCDSLTKRDGGKSTLILHSDLLPLLRELIALRAKPAAMDGDVEVRIAEIKAREAKATKGEWTMWGGGGYVSVGVTEVCQVIDKMPGASYGPGWNQNSDNLFFCAKARTDIPYLVAQVESLRAANANLKAVTAEAMQVIDEAYAATGFIKVAKTSEQRMRIEAAIAPPSPAPDAEGK